MKTYIAHYIGPAMEYRDIRAGESAYDTCELEIEAENEEQAKAKANKLAEEMGEGKELVEIEETFPMCKRCQEEPASEDPKLEGCCSKSCRNEQYLADNDWFGNYN